jgi:signal transduction histidine kinase/CheY-like chemotaxis protein
MRTGRDSLGFEAELTGIRQQSLTTMCALAGAAGYVFLSWLVWLVIDEVVISPACAWVGATLLLFAPLAAWKLSSRWLPCASAVLVAAVAASVICVVLAFPSREAAYLFVLPVVLAHVLLGQSAFAAVAVLAELAASLQLRLRFGVSLLSSGAVFPLATIALVSAASGFSAQNLHTTLVWALDGYTKARRGEERARENQAELRKVLKALDEATYRLERLVSLLSQARDQADEARRLKQQFAQNISHELRTPLSLIVGFAELMTESPEHYGDPLPTPYQRDLNIIYRNARHLQDLVNDVLDLARIDAAQMSLVLEEAEPAALVQEAVNTAWGLIDARGLALATEIAPNLPHLRVDPTRIRQVLINLLNNAARFTERGGITLRVRREGDEVIFAVADTGVGIAPEDIPRIFEEFRQADGSTRRRHDGVGLGLAISRRFVQLHGGRIWVESRVGEGSTFYFSLPVDRPAQAVAADGRATDAKKALPYGVEEEAVALVVTTNASSAALFARYVRDLRLVVVSDLEQARRAAATALPQIVVIDQGSQPVASGELEAMGQEWGLVRTPFVVCPLPGEERLDRHAGADGYLFKPVSMRHLGDVLRQFGENVDTVLVVDDDRDFVQLVSRVLEGGPVRRYRALGAHSGQECLDMLRAYRPDLVLLDLGLPDLDGFQVLERIRSTPEWGRLPVVVVTAQDALDAQEPLLGSLMLTRAEGLLPNEIAHLVRSLASSSATSSPTYPGPRAAAAL